MSPEHINRRQALALTAFALASVALPTGVAAYAASTAELFYTPDEPWGLFVRGHVSQQQFTAAALRLIESDPNIREDTEDWLWEETMLNDFGNEFAREICGASEHRYMHLTHRSDPELGEAYQTCRAHDAGAIPITVVMY